MIRIIRANTRFEANTIYGIHYTVSNARWYYTHDFAEKNALVCFLLLLSLNVNHAVYITAQYSCLLYITRIDYCARCSYHFTVYTRARFVIDLPQQRAFFHPEHKKRMS